jgi:hypothetical protein
MKFVPVSPVARLENTTVPESVAVAQTSSLLLELTALTRSWALAPELSEICWPSIVTVSAAVGLVKENVRCAEEARFVTPTW